MEFPRTVFHSPGIYPAGWGKSFDHLQVESQAHYDAALKAGWYESVPEAIENTGKKLGEVVIEQPKPAKTAAKAEG